MCNIFNSGANTLKKHFVCKCKSQSHITKYCLKFSQKKRKAGNQNHVLINFFSSALLQHRVTQGNLKTEETVLFLFARRTKFYEYYDVCVCVRARAATQLRGNIKRRYCKYVNS